MDHFGTSDMKSPAASNQRESTGTTGRLGTPSPAAGKTGRRYLNVPYDERFNAKRAGARWDPESKRWWVNDAADMTPFLAWLYTGATDKASATREWHRPKQNRSKNR